MTILSTFAAMSCDVGLASGRESAACREDPRHCEEGSRGRLKKLPKEVSDVLRRQTPS